jgi:hypothetical protein
MTKRCWTVNGRHRPRGDLCKVCGLRGKGTHLEVRALRVAVTVSGRLGWTTCGDMCIGKRPSGAGQSTGDTGRVGTCAKCEGVWERHTLGSASSTGCSDGQWSTWLDNLCDMCIGKWQSGAGQSTGDTGRVGTCAKCEGVWERHTLRLAGSVGLP